MYRQIRFSIWFPIVILAVFVVAWLWIREFSAPEPYDLEPVSIVRNNGSAGSSSNRVLRGWQTYRNEKYSYKYDGELLHYEFKYPSDWISKDGPGGVVIRGVEGKCSASFGGGAASQSTFDYTLIEKNEVLVENEVVEFQVLKNKFEGADIKYFIPVSLSNGLEMSGLIMKEDYSSCLEIFKAILSTFKFIDSAS